ncbi:PQQ-binding-like beta-propeller repeat protein [Aquimarina sp. ERC-38]|uniref:outer membrane protein assembly factor BamB family protein n=1 Tax=Aquimarina sp. ERC-38 TaxID=2949996 RepID=UPI00224512FD|nr:PQQ-binding-like beta-propeller repeat protein [Aquimarina sp. ERC-38]UZO80841.1 PQQ-binding-like beta-propeller repeat protein [Aquimarina sp. ERC-38]
MKHHYVSILLFLSISLFAQRTATKTLTFDSKVQDLIIVPFNGIAAISDNSKVHGYNPDTQELVWSIDIPKSNGVAIASKGLANASSLLSINGGDGNDFVVIPDTPFLQKFFDNRLYIINSFNGDILFAPTEDKESFFQAEYLFDEDAMLLRGLQDKSLVIAKYSLKEKKYLWKTTVSEKFGNFFTKLSSAMGEDPTAGKDEMQYSEDKVFILAKSKFYVLDKKTGTLLWKVEDTKKNVDSFFNSLDGAYVLLTEVVGLLGTKEMLDLRDAATGNKIWKDPIKTKYLVLFEDWQDKMLLAHYRGFNFYDYKTGEKLWEKDPKGSGIKSVIPIDQDFLYVYDDEMMLLDKNGQKKWKKDINISDDEEDPIFFLEKTDNGKILYVTATYANLVDYTTGQKIWKKDLKLKNDRPTFAKYDEKIGDFVIYNDEKLYRFNKATTERPEPFAKLKLKNEKLITSMELFPNNVSITGQSEVVVVANSGSVVFHNKYVQPGELARKFGKVALQIGSVAAAVATTEVTTSVTYRDANGNTITQTSEPQALFGKRAQAIGEAGYFAGAFSQQFVQDRFNALQENERDVIIFAKGDNKERLLIKVNKENGKEEDKIIVENTKPVYDYDAVSGDLYYSKGNEVMIFKSL